MKKTLIISLELPPQVGGIATYVHQLANSLDHQQTVVLAPPHAEAKEWDEKQPYRVIRKKLLGPRFFRPRWLKLVWIVWRLVKKEKIELIILHHVLPVGYAAWVMKKVKKISYLIFSHGTDVLLGTSNAWKKTMMRILVKDGEQIVFNSESLKRRFLRVLPQFAKQSLVLYPCPDIDFFTPPLAESLEELRHRYALEGKKVILSIARLDEGKGFPHLIRIMPEVLKKVPNLVWFIIGDGPKRNTMIGLIQRYSLQNVVRYLGILPHSELKPFYYLSDAFILLTHPDEGREEGLGLVFLEAAAAGLPVIAGKSGGVEEGVIHGVNGLVVDIYKGDQNVAASIADLFLRPDYGRQLGEAGRERMRRDFRWEIQLKRLDFWIQ